MFINGTLDELYFIVLQIIAQSPKIISIKDWVKERSEYKYKIQIIESLKWIGIIYDGIEYIQSAKINEHIKIANQLLEKGFAYNCYCSDEEIIEQKY